MTINSQKIGLLKKIIESEFENQTRKLNCERTLLQEKAIEKYKKANGLDKIKEEISKYRSKIGELQDKLSDYGVLEGGGIDHKNSEAVLAFIQAELGDKYKEPTTIKNKLIYDLIKCETWEEVDNLVLPIFGTLPAIESMKNKEAISEK